MNDTLQVRKATIWIGQGGRELVLDATIPGDEAKAKALLAHCVSGAMICAMLPIKSVPVGTARRGRYLIRVVTPQEHPDWCPMIAGTVASVLGAALESYHFLVEVSKEEDVKQPEHADG